MKSYDLQYEKEESVRPDGGKRVEGYEHQRKRLC
jgi:hypothetical protein